MDLARYRSASQRCPICASGTHEARPPRRGARGARARGAPLLYAAQSAALCSAQTAPLASRLPRRRRQRRREKGYRMSELESTAAQGRQGRWLRSSRDSHSWTRGGAARCSCSCGWRARVDELQGIWHAEGAGLLLQTCNHPHHNSTSLPERVVISLSSDEEGAMASLKERLGS